MEKIIIDIAKFYDKDISLFCVEELNYCFDKIDDISLRWCQILFKIVSWLFYRLQLIQILFCEKLKL
ncbi:hypothetical protein [Borrelia miyamotoi]|uniref:Uncharacterized protein n=1 Tax=Borrelia miyamotoi TaxID=47466 RepID=A0AAQ2WV90_9SPIR|nr:hypothetical protein [Borrelia miyamotoi]QTL83368.1 hypothetical protein bmLB2001_000214 [Borrelia miyamotoi]WAZ85336.1 hypothetical protein O5400_03190 [Borrelia miyamotoi]WAZ91119.1 hypothetical protein O5398_03195 [Borrelia miyamotoi]WAZ92405.1 hypothetical protein O5402_03190 [Borrelia miyamotoi]WAZ93696.1 hypothetical protein O5399_03195 [Borrelia miyamotoi]